MQSNYVDNCHFIARKMNVLLVPLFVSISIEKHVNPQNKDLSNHDRI